LQKFRLSAHLLGVFFDDVFGSPVWFTQSAVNTFVWVDDQKVRAFIKAVYRAYFNTIGVFALNAVFANNKSHLKAPFYSRSKIMAGF
jgi:hypothetical protein